MRRGTEQGGIADENIEPAITFVERRRKRYDARLVPEIERHQCGGSAFGADRIVELPGGSISALRRKRTGNPGTASRVAVRGEGRA